MRSITFLGTGHATVVDCFNSCFYLKDGRTSLLVDLGGGLGLLGRLRRAGIRTRDIQNVFITHGHSDHILGLMGLAYLLKQDPSHKVRIFCSAAVKRTIEALFRRAFPSNARLLKESLLLNVVGSGKSARIGSLDATFFDLHSRKLAEQLGLHLCFKDKTRLVFFGDEPLKPGMERYAKGADIFIHEAFCLQREQARFGAHAKGHSTVSDAAKAAQQANARRLILIHMGDNDLKQRKRLYGEEARRFFQGPVVVPADLETVRF